MTQEMPAQPPPSPWPIFDAWLAEAERCELIKYATAMCLSTVDPEGLPDARIVLLESHDASGMAFFTDVESVKARSLSRFPEAAVTFYWGPLDRQVRLRGAVEPAPDELADEFFARRPRASQITAWASAQSRVLDDPQTLDRRYRKVETEFAEHEAVPRPAHWAAFRVVAREVELWQAKARRLHDRLRYLRAPDGTWTVERLFP